MKKQYFTLMGSSLFVATASLFALPSLSVMPPSLPGTKSLLQPTAGEIQEAYKILDLIEQMQQTKHTDPNLGAISFDEEDTILPKNIEEMRDSLIKDELLTVLSVTPYSDAIKHLKDCKKAIKALQRYEDVVEDSIEERGIHLDDDDDENDKDEAENKRIETKEKPEDEDEDDDLDIEIEALTFDDDEQSDSPKTHTAEQAVTGDEKNEMPASTTMYNLTATKNDSTFADIPQPDETTSLQESQKAAPLPEPETEPVSDQSLEPEDSTPATQPKERSEAQEPITPEPAPFSPETDSTENLLSVETQATPTMLTQKNTMPTDLMAPPETPMTQTPHTVTQDTMEIAPEPLPTEEPETQTEEMPPPSPATSTQQEEMPQPEPLPDE